MKSLQSQSATLGKTAFRLKAFGVLVTAMGLWTAGNAPKAQGLDRAAGSAAGIAASAALQAVPGNKPERFANRFLTEDPVVLAQVATRAINNIRSKLDSCGDNGMLALPEERAKSTAAPIKVSSMDVAARPALVFNPRLADAALKHSRAMAELGFFDHTDPAGKTVGGRSKESGYRYRVVGENIAAGHDSVEDAVRGWLLSSSHCENMIDPRFVEFGIAKVTSTNPSDPYGSYWTLVLGQPRVDQTASR
jgi:Cysteine-rich secretory protein family